MPIDDNAGPSRVLFVSAIFATPGMPKIQGGAEVVAHRLATALAARGVAIDVVRASPPGSSVPDEAAQRIPVTSLAMRRPYWPFEEGNHGAAKRLLWHLLDDVGDERRIAAVMRRVAPDVVHTHNIGGLSTGAWRAAAGLGVPIVHTLHDYYLLCPRTTRFRGSRCGALCADCRLLTMRRRADADLVGDVVGVSRAVLDEHLGHGLFADSRHHVVHNMVATAPAAARALAERPVTFGFLGRITVEKGVERLVEAFGRMRAPARLLFGGRIDDAMRARLLALAGGKPIEFLGFVRPDDFFRAIDVLVVPSIWSDPLPTVILEAQTAGRPAIGARRGGIPEAIGPEEAGWIYDPDQPGALMSLLDDVAGRPAAVAAKAAAARRASERFREETVTDRYLAIYGRAIVKQ